MCHKALWHTVTLQLHRFEHLLADRLINIRRCQAEATRHRGSSGQQGAKLFICDTTFALRVGLDETNVLSLGVVLHMIQADIALRNMSDLAGNVVEGPPENLVQTKLTASWAILRINLIEDRCMVCKAFAPIY